MTKVDWGIYILTALCIIGIVVLTVMDKQLSVLTPILTALIGVIIGKQGGAIYGKVAGVFKSKK